MASTLFRRRGSILRSNSSPPTAQSNSPCGPAMKPSRVINGDAITFLIVSSLGETSSYTSETYAAHPADFPNHVRASRQILEEPSDRLKQPINGLEKGIVSDFASQVLPEALH